MANLNEISWAKANAEIGLKHNEICPGLTVNQHAESLAMFETRNMPAPDKTYKFALPVVRHVIEKKLYGGVAEDDIEP